MIELGRGDYEIAGPLLSAAPFNVLMAQGVVAGRVSGRVLVDTTEPSSAFIKHKYGMSWLIGYSDSADYQDAVIAEIVDDRRTSPEWLQVYPLDWTELIDPLVDTGQVAKWRRTNFWFNRARFLALFPRKTLAARTAPCSLGQIESFTGSVLPRHFWDSTAELVTSGFAFFSLTPSGEPAAIAFASHLDPDNLEIGVETLPDHRGHGYAQAACARLIHSCIEHDRLPGWSCRTENEASYWLAHKVGFVPVLQVPYYELPWNGPPIA